MKFRTRKNSTNVQLRGRKPGSVRGAGGPKVLERQHSRENPPSQPHQDLPTYTEATRSSKPDVPPGNSTNDQQSSGGSTPSGSNLPEIPTLNVYTPTLETIESVESGTGSSEAKVTTDGDSTAVVSHDQPAAREVAIVTDKEDRVEDHPNESSDFARNVRCGTSTPIDESPKVESTRGQTFDDATTDTVDTDHVELSIVHDDTGSPELVTDMV